MVVGVTCHLVAGTQKSCLSFDATLPTSTDAASGAAFEGMRSIVTGVGRASWPTAA